MQKDVPVENFCNFLPTQAILPNKKKKYVSVSEVAETSRLCKKGYTHIFVTAVYT